MKYILRLSRDCCDCLYDNNEDKNKRKSIDGQEYVEANGLKWSIMNIGASKESEDGLYFAWGEIDGYTRWGKQNLRVKTKSTSNNWTNYKFYDVESESIIKYNLGDGKTILDLEDDTAYILWGGKWRMPTTEEVEPLISKSKWTSSYEGRAGFLYLDEKGNLLFFPASTNTINPGSINVQGCYWTSTLSETLEDPSDGYADHLHISKNQRTSPNRMIKSERYGGFTIRPVWDDNLEPVQIPFTHWYDGVLFRVSGTNLEAFKYQGLYMCISNGDIVLQDIDESVLTEALNIIKGLNPDIKKVVTGDIKNYDKNRFNIGNIEEIESE